MNDEKPVDPKHIWGVGMPAALYLDQFARIAQDFFEGYGCYLVGSAVHCKQWRDVDVRLILSDEEYERWGFGKPDDSHQNAKWVAASLAFSELGRKMTGLPIDFQIQQQSDANTKYPGQRNYLGLTPAEYARISGNLSAAK
jgi:hypothetical protein